MGTDGTNQCSALTHVHFTLCFLGDRGPSFEVRSGAPDQADLAKALDQLHRRAASGDLGEDDQGDEAKEVTESDLPKSETDTGEGTFGRLNAVECVGNFSIRLVKRASSPMLHISSNSPLKPSKRVLFWS